jgi:hypothetical protein
MNLFYVMLHEIGQSLGLNHVMNRSTIMFPSYICFKILNAFNFTFDTIDSKLIKTMYANYYTTTEKPTTLKLVSETT